MAFPASARARFLGHWISVQDDARRFGPIRLVAAGIQQAHVGYMMLLVVGRNRRPARRFVGHVWIEFWRNSHRRTPSGLQEVCSRCAPANDPL